MSVRHIIINRDCLQKKRGFQILDAAFFIYSRDTRGAL